MIFFKPICSAYPPAYPRLSHVRKSGACFPSTAWMPRRRPSITPAPATTCSASPPISALRSPCSSPLPPRNRACAEPNTGGEPALRHGGRPLRSALCSTSCSAQARVRARHRYPRRSGHYGRHLEPSEYNPFTNLLFPVALCPHPSKFQNLTFRCARSTTARWPATYRGKRQHWLAPTRSGPLTFVPSSLVLAAHAGGLAACLLLPLQVAYVGCLHII